MKLNVINDHIPISIGLLSVYFQIPGCHSLKEKRSIIKPILSKVQREFQASISEVGFQDRWQESVIACVTVSNDSSHTQSFLQKIYQYIVNRHPEIVVVDHKIELT